MSDEDLELANTLEDDSGPPAGGGEAGDFLEAGASLGRYVILGLLGSGGMGIVYSAFDPQLDRKVACKVLRRKWDQDARLRLQREAKAMAKLSHPNVVSVYEVGTDAGHVFVVMELVDGQDIESWGREEHSPREILDVYRQAGEGLAAAHRAGLVHRDFKPQNVLIDTEGRVQVTDFGLARKDSQAAAAQEPTSSPAEGVLVSDELTVTGHVMGTPAYMAPEQHLAKEVDARSDQFCFCVSLYEALCGQRPFPGETYAALYKQVTTRSPRPLPDSVEVPVAVREALAKGLARDPEERFASMHDLLAKLGERPRRKRLGLWPLLAAAVVLVGITAAGVWFWTDSGSKSEACVADESVLEGSWDARVRGQLRDAFAASGSSAWEPIFAAFETRLDDYGGELVAMRQEICRANRGPEAVGDQAMVLQMACLQKRRQALAALTQAFVGAEASHLDWAVQAAMGLEPVSACRDLESLQRGVEAPPPAVAEQVELLRGQLREANSLAEAGQTDVAISLAESVRDESLNVAYEPLRAEALVMVGQLLSRAVRLAEARKVFEEAVLVAEESEHLEMRARALVALTEIMSGGSSEFEQARRYGRQARAAIDHWGGAAAGLNLQLSASLARMKEQEGKRAEALAMLLRALHTAEGQSDVSPLSLAKLKSRIADLYISQGKFETAHAFAKASHQLVKEALGDGHPRRFRYLEKVGTTHRMLGDFERAHEIELLLREFWRGERGQRLLRGSKQYRATSRSISGVVVGVHGEPVAGATVVCGHRVFGDSNRLAVGWDSRRDALYRLRIVLSSDGGQFLCEDATTREFAVVADHADIGRSAAFYGADSRQDVTGISLQLQTPGSLSGRIEDGADPGAVPYVMAIPVEESAVSPRYSISALVRDGGYRLGRLAPGRYKVVVGSKSHGPDNQVRSGEVRIESGKAATLNFGEPLGTAGLRLTLEGAYGTPLHSVQLLIAEGHHAVTTGKQFGEEVYGKGVSFRHHFLADGETLEIDDLPPGLHSVCFVPLAGDHRDPEYMRTVSREVRANFVIHCHDVELAAGEVFEDKTKVPVGPAR